MNAVEREVNERHYQDFDKYMWIEKETIENIRDRISFWLHIML